MGTRREIRGADLLGLADFASGKATSLNLFRRAILGTRGPRTTISRQYGAAHSVGRLSVWELDALRLSPLHCFSSHEYAHPALLFFD